MSAQREKVAALKREVRNAEKDGVAAAVLDRLRQLLAAEEQTLLRSREPGQNRTVADLAADAPDSED